MCKKKQSREEILDLREKLLSAEANRLAGAETYSTAEVSQKLRKQIDAQVNPVLLTKALQPFAHKG